MIRLPRFRRGDHPDPTSPERERLQDSSLEKPDGETSKKAELDALTQDDYF